MAEYTNGSMDQNNSQSIPQTENTPNTSDDFKNVFDEVSPSFDDAPLSSDHFFNNTLNWLNSRDRLYYNLLDQYVNITSIRNENKEKKKNDFYILIKNMLVVSLIIFFIFAIKIFLSPIESIATIVPVIIGGFISILGILIGLPTIVANYLFNNSEDDNITTIITHTQDFDMNGRKEVYGKGQDDKNKE